jgi:hypothetical protein
MKSFFGKALEVANAAAIINACFLLGIIIFVLIGISPFVGNITRHMQEARYRSPIDDLSSEAKQAKVSEAIKIATSDGLPRDPTSPVTDSCEDARAFA